MLPKEFDGQLECLGENREKYKTFLIPIKNKLGNGKTITCNIKFIDSFRFMASLLASLVNNLSERLHKDKCIDCESCLVL